MKLTWAGIKLVMECRHNADFYLHLIWRLSGLTFKADKWHHGALFSLCVRVRVRLRVRVWMSLQHVIYGDPALLSDLSPLLTRALQRSSNGPSIASRYRPGNTTRPHNKTWNSEGITEADKSRGNWMKEMGGKGGGEARWGTDYGSEEDGAEVTHREQ